MLVTRCRALRRTIFSPLYSAVPFSDIILADILTSSAKVLGDVWVSGCLLFTVTQRFGMGGEDAAASGCARVLMVPVMTRCVSWGVWQTRLDRGADIRESRDLAASHTSSDSASACPRS